MTKENTIQFTIITIILEIMANINAFPMYWRIACGIWFVIFLAEEFRFLIKELKTLLEERRVLWKKISMKN